MNSYWQVALTYGCRRRFWIFAVCYLAMGSWWIASIDPRMQVLASANLACIVGCFIALQVRRQFGTSSAHLMPGFAAPHLAVGALAGLFIWFFVPAVQIALGNWPTSALAFHAVAGLLLPIVACWPRAIILLTALPVAFIYAANVVGVKESVVARLMAGQEPWLGAALVAAAVLAHPFAALVLLRLPDGSASADELTIEPQVSGQPLSRWSQWNLARRDVAVEQTLRTAGWWGWTVRRWRVPMAVSWAQLALPVVLVLAAIGSAPWLTPNTWAQLSLATMLVTTSVILIAPFGPWHPRRHWLARELMLPVTRGRFFRQLAWALALNVCLWTMLATALSMFVVYCISGPPTYVLGPYFFVEHAAILWGMAVLLYGLALLTFGFRYWIPVIVVLGGAWASFAWWVGAWVCFACSAIVWSCFNRYIAPELGEVYFIPLASAAVGLLLAGIAYRRWLAADVA